MLGTIIAYFYPSYIEVKYQPPPSINPNIIGRQALMNDIVNKLCQATVDSCDYGVSLTITGAGGFGKSTIVKALCHHPVVRKKFTHGFVFINLGPKAIDPMLKLRSCYRLLTNDSELQCDLNVADQKIKQLTSNFYCNLLVIIDDVAMAY